MKPITLFGLLTIVLLSVGIASGDLSDQLYDCYEFNGTGVLNGTILQPTVSPGINTSCHYGSQCFDFSGTEYWIANNGTWSNIIKGDVDWSVNFWAYWHPGHVTGYPDLLTGYPAVFSHIYGEDRVPTGNNNVRWNNASTWYGIGDGSIPEGTWNMITIVHDADKNYTIYKNNVLNDSDDVNMGNPWTNQGSDNGGDNYGWGKRADGGGVGWEGKAQGLSIWTRTINITERTELYNGSEGIACNQVAGIVDTTAPTLIFSPDTDSTEEFYASQAVTIFCTDETSLDECYYNVTEPDTTLTQYTTNESITLDQIGNWSVLYYADDSSDNVNTSTVTLEVLDSTAPSLVFSPDTDDTKEFLSNQAVTISCTDLDKDECYYNITEPNATLTQYTTNETISLNQIGNWSLLYYADDNTGNVNSSLVTLEVLDTANPTIIYSPLVDFSASRDATQDVTHVCIDVDLDECYYNITAPDTTVTQYTTNETITLDQTGTWEFLFYADDLSSNSANATVRGTVTLTDAQVVVPDVPVIKVALIIIFLIMFIITIFPRTAKDKTTSNMMMLVIATLGILIAVMYFLNIWFRTLG